MVEKLARAEVGAMTEHRAFARHKTFIKGRIYFNNRLSSVDCIVRDLADIGARLEISENVTLPIRSSCTFQPGNSIFRPG